MYFCIITYIHKLSSVLTWNRHNNVAELTSQWHPNLPLLCLITYKSMLKTKTFRPRYVTYFFINYISIK
jgi:hypothetical protein